MTKKPNAANNSTKDNDKDGEKKEKSHLSILLQVAKQATLFHTPMDEAYARVPIDKYFDVYNIQSNAFKKWLTYQFYLQKKIAPSADALMQAINTIEAKALYEGKQKSVYRRCA